MPLALRMPEEMHMRKELIAVALTAAWAGCGQGEGMAVGSMLGGEGGPMVGVTTKVKILNQGAVSVRVVTTSKSVQDPSNDANDDITLGPAQSQGYTLQDVKTLEIKAWRTSDSVEILSEAWDEGDLLLNPTVHVTLTP